VKEGKGGPIRATARKKKQPFVWERREKRKDWNKNVTQRGGRIQSSPLGGEGNPGLSVQGKKKKGDSSSGT